MLGRIDLGQTSSMLAALANIGELFATLGQNRPELARNSDDGAYVRQHCLDNFGARQNRPGLLGFCGEQVFGNFRSLICHSRHLQ